MRTIAITAIVGIVLFTAWAICDDIKADRAWSQYAAAHCHVIGHMDGDVGIAASGGKNGVAVVATDGKTGWQCDDGQTYWRND